MKGCKITLKNRFEHFKKPTYSFNLDPISQKKELGIPALFTYSYLTSKIAAISSSTRLAANTPPAVFQTASSTL